MEVGGHLTLRLPYEGQEACDEHALAILRLPPEWDQFARRAAQRAKDVVLAASRQRIRER
jgi:hypothetical protein